MPKSPLFPIFLTVFVDVLGLTIVLPLLPFYAEHFGAPPIVVGALAASYALCQLVSGPILGRISDRVGRKPTLLVSQMGTFAAFLMIGSAHALWMLFLGRIIDGMTAGNLAIAQAYISDVTRPENRTRAFALIGIAFGSGFLVGPAISGVVAQRYGYGAPAFVAAGLSALSVLCTATLLPRTPPRPDGEPAPSRTRSMGRFFSREVTRDRLVAFFCFALSFGMYVGGNALFLERRLGFDVAKVGWIFAYSGLVGGLVQGGIITRLVKRLGEARLSALGFACMGVGFGAVGFAHSLAHVLVCATIAGFGSAVVRPALTTLITKSVGTHEQGAALGVSQSLASVANILGPLTAGFLIQHDLLGTFGLVTGAVALVGVVVIWRAEPEDAPVPT